MEETQKQCKECEATPDMIVFAGHVISQFAEDCMKMAEENWCHDHCQMLDRLFTAVMTGEEYAPAPDPEE